MPQRIGPRLDERNQGILTAYLSGRTQTEIADEHGIGQQHVSEILSNERDRLLQSDRAAMAALDLGRTEVLLNTAMRRYSQGDTASGVLALRVMERRSKVLGYDASEPLSVTLSRRQGMDADLVTGAVTAALSGMLAALPTPPEHQRALGNYVTALAQRALLDGLPEDELPPVPDVPAWPGEVPTSRHVTIRSGPQEDPDQAEMQRWIAEYEAEYGPMGEDDDEDAA